MSLDLSPDGRTIVFDLLGDLYTMPILGGAAKRITSGMALNRQPRFSPDGRQIVFISDRSGSDNVWIADVNGGNLHQISNLQGQNRGIAVTSPTWLPDGRTIVVCQKLLAVRNGPISISLSQMWLLATYDVFTRKMRWVSDTTPARAQSAIGPTIGPRKNELYAAVNFLPPGSSIILGEWRIARIELETGRILPELGGNVGRIGVRPLLSPNRRFLVYGSSSGSHLGLRLRDLQTDSERWLIQERLDDPSGREGDEARDLVPGYAFTPDSKGLIAAYGGKIHHLDLATNRTTVIPFVAEVKRGLGPLTVYQFGLPDTAVRTRAIMQPALSPDGRRVAFSALDRIWLMDIPEEGSEARPPTRLTGDSVGEFSPSWAPDGQWITYAAWHDGEGGGVWRAPVPLPGAVPVIDPRRLTADTALYFNPVVSSDGQRIIAFRWEAASRRVLSEPAATLPQPVVNPALLALPANGGAPEVVTSLDGVAEINPPYYPARQLYLTDDPERVYVGLASWRRDGSEPRLALVVPDDSSMVRSEGAPLKEPWNVAGFLSPDGRRGLISWGSALYQISRGTVSDTKASTPDTLDFARAQTRAFGAPGMAARLWGNALTPWVSWSRNGRRIAFSQGGALYVSDVSPGEWLRFRRVDVPMTINPDRPRGTIVLRGARLVTMHGPEIIERGDLVVRDNRIAAVGPSGRVAIPPGARVLDLAGTTILPGYVDVHDHSAFHGGIHGNENWRELIKVAFGVTTTRDPFALGTNDIFSYSERERVGDLLAPRLFSTGQVVDRGSPPIRTVDDALEAVRPHAVDFRTETFKFYFNPSTNRRTAQLVALATHKRGLNLTAHVYGLNEALADALDGFSGIEHAPAIRIYDDVASLMAGSGSTWTWTFGGAAFGTFAFMVRREGFPWEWARVRRFLPPAEREGACGAVCTGEGAAAESPLELANLHTQVDGPARIVAKGGRIAIGSHGNIPGLGYHYEMWLHAIGGMSPYQVLRSATIVGATAIGHQADLGSLEVGKLADLQVLNKNPLADIHNTASIRYVMKNGRLYEADDLTEIWPRHRPLPSIYVWDTTATSDSTRTTAHPRSTSDSRFPTVPARGGRGKVRKQTTD
jgi:imidazolonepropionase-like amidohydrolase/WD40 repeat protein